MSDLLFAPYLDASLRLLAIPCALMAIAFYLSPDAAEAPDSVFSLPKIEDKPEVELSTNESEDGGEFDIDRSSAVVQVKEIKKDSTTQAESAAVANLKQARRAAPEARKENVAISAPTGEKQLLKSMVGERKDRNSSLLQKEKLSQGSSKENKKVNVRSSKKKGTAYKFDLGPILSC